MEQLQRFSKNFILDGMSLILKYNYFYINDSFIHRIKGTAMSTYAAIAYMILQVLNYVTGIIIYDLTGTELCHRYYYIRSYRYYRC